MKIVVGIAALAAAALALAGCTNSDDDASTAPSPTPTTVAEGQTSSPAPSVGNLDDPLCAAAQDSVSVATTLESTAGDLEAMLQDPTFLTSDDVSELNGWGEDMLTLSNETLKFYEIGVDETEGEDVNADFAALKGFVSDYTVTLAQAAADAKSPAEFVTNIQTAFADPDVQAAASGAPAAGQNVATYLKERCGIIG